MFIRGLKLLAIAYILNFVRLTIPSLIAYGISGDYSFIADWPDKLMRVDILQFAGMAFLVIALFKKLKLDWWWLLLFSIAVLGASIELSFLYAKAKQAILARHKAFVRSGIPFSRLADMDKP